MKNEDIEHKEFMKQLNIGLEMHFSCSKSLTSMIEGLLVYHPYHSQRCQQDFNFALTMILHSTKCALDELIRNHSNKELVFEKGRICIDIEKRGQRLGIPGDDEEEFDSEEDGDGDGDEKQKAAEFCEPEVE